MDELFWEDVPERYERAEYVDKRFENERAAVPGGWLYRLTVWSSAQRSDGGPPIAVSITFVPTPKEG